MVGTLEKHMNELEQDADCDLDQFGAWMLQIVPRFMTFHKEMAKSVPDEFKDSMSRKEWMEEFQGFVDFTDGQQEDEAAQQSGGDDDEG